VSGGGGADDTVSAARFPDVHAASRASVITAKRALTSGSADAGDRSQD
jgi:hypothetical protein